MQQNALIFTEQRILPRLLDVLMSVIAWLGFSWLIFKGVVTEITNNAHAGPHPFFSTVNTLTLYIAVALLNGAMLIFWAKYNQIRFHGVERRQRRPGLERAQLAESFEVPETLLAELAKARVVTVHHSDSGGISRIEIQQLQK
ncbi:poly-beta-1,6-N-acetyl-D-glucosamine biosynthesis protein PgaD [Scandinavium goeteborgense]|uniref:poly-beta-1,6-N-acetyl-D-glucosamine biosynthesis protein PgaD n=1 Tax=Scandinavium TaxID=2726810 RepID=UPI002166BC41|nr:MULTISPECIES: poly-beta-1,6-N-acetyl-D-glucosamine biosynthesis protein PgaD [Scandinavium]MCS2151258.1 poly-beta-1,6-N-acetyl-D-glucosamine biosynthesis protein PgaD [Scandinavium goeteborgense]MCS2169581.1 poly-beta-1,6-N-acetyl-D-glucosamine biosynthesis protein PgaD [Scandinavium tedordense]